MAEEKVEGVYGENVGVGGLDDERGVREETVEAHPQPSGDTADSTDAVDAAEDVKTRGAEAIEGSEGDTEDDLEAVRRGAAQDTGSGGMGRDGVPRNEGDAPQGDFTQPDEELKRTPG